LTGATHVCVRTIIPTGRIRGHIDELLAQDKQLPEILEQVVRLVARVSGLASGLILRL
jgi:hypothetical protein